MGHHVVWTLVLSMALLLLATPARGAEPAAAAPPLQVFAKDATLHVVSAGGGAELLKVGPLVWGPNWGWTGIDGAFKTSGDGAVGAFKGTLGDAKVPFTLDVRVAPKGGRQLDVAVEFKVERDADLTLAVVALEAGRSLRGKGRATVVDAAGSGKAVDLPLGRGAVSGQVRRLEMRDDKGQAFVTRFAEPTAVQADGAARAVLAADRLAAGDVRRLAFTVDLPADATFLLTPESVPMPANWDQWFAWTATGKADQESVIDVSGWLDAPAGKHGRVTRQGDALVYNGKPAKFWGVNASFGNCAPPKDRAERQAAFYAKYGINSVRLHKYADGPGWAGICTDGAADFDAKALDRMDYYVAQLKQRGIYTKLSANFGSLPLGPADLKALPFANEIKANDDGWARGGQGALWFSDELQQLQMAQLLKVLEHTNAHTGQRYAEDPAVMCVELVNENSVFFYTTMPAMQTMPTIKRLAGEAFFAWLKDKYQTEEALVAAWGQGIIGTFKDEKLADESWATGLIYPAGNPWFFDPDNLNGSQAARKQRLLDTMQFLYDQQNRFYDRFVRAIRETGYTGEIITSNWQAGRAMSHYYNLHSDARVGMIDRHNYFGGAGAMVASPGGGSLSSGMQQVADRPFMLSEWIHVFPNEFGVEGPAIIGAYGLGLNGWDVSYLFQNGDEGTFRRELREQWDAVAPQIIGVFPAVARQVYRGDVQESDLVFSRNVHVPSLAQGKLGFDDRVEQGYDEKEFGSDAVPAATLAIGRGVVTYTEQETPTERVDVKQYLKDGMVHSATGQLAWRPGESPRDGYFTIDTPGTQAIVGFASGHEAKLRDVTLTPKTDFAAVYVTALGRDGAIANDGRLLVTTIARVRNTGMKLAAGTLLDRGKSPMLVEPVAVDLKLNRTGKATVHVLDHDGRRTGKTVSVTDGVASLDGAKTKAVYYEVTFD